jgi:hypothetical protein
MEVQLGQREAFAGMLVKQKGHSLVAGGAGSAVFLRACNAATGLTTKKKATAAIIRKLMRVFMNNPCPTL